MGVMANEKKIVNRHFSKKHYRVSSSGLAVSIKGGLKMKNEVKTEFVKIAAVWENEKSLKIKVEEDIKKGEFLFMIKNKFKDQQKEKAPDYNIFRVVKEFLE